VCCSVLQSVAVCCSALQCVAVCCSVLQCVAVCCRQTSGLPHCRTALIRCLYVWLVLCRQSHMIIQYNMTYTATIWSYTMQCYVDNRIERYEWIFCNDEWNKSKICTTIWTDSLRVYVCVCVCVWLTNSSLLVSANTNLITSDLMHSAVRCVCVCDLITNLITLYTPRIKGTIKGNQQTISTG